jgi:hypothetical protein
MDSDFINVIVPAVSQMRALDDYESRREFIEYLILLLCDINPYFVMHYIFGIAKCTTIRLGISLEGFTHKMIMQILGSVLRGTLGSRYQRPFQILIMSFGMVV